MSYDLGKWRVPPDAFVASMKAVDITDKIATIGEAMYLSFVMRMIESGKWKIRTIRGSTRDDDLSLVVHVSTKNNAATDYVVGKGQVAIQNNDGDWVDLIVSDEPAKPQEPTPFGARELDMDDKS